jgi:hypothetical protein
VGRATACSPASEATEGLRLEHQQWAMHLVGQITGQRTRGADRRGGGDTHWHDGGPWPRRCLGRRAKAQVVPAAPGTTGTVRRGSIRRSSGGRHASATQRRARVRGGREQRGALGGRKALGKGECWRGPNDRDSALWLDSGRKGGGSGWGTAPRGKKTMARRAVREERRETDRWV